MKKLFKSKDKKLSGVLGGIAEYYNIDPTLVRVGFVFLLIFTGIIPGIIFYFFAALIVPDHDGHHAEHIRPTATEDIPTS